MENFWQWPDRERGATLHYVKGVTDALFLLIGAPAFFNVGFLRPQTTERQKWIPTFLHNGVNLKPNENFPINQPYRVSAGTKEQNTMKKYYFILAAALLAASCTTTTKTARTEAIPYSMYNANVADLQVGDRISYTYSPSKEIRRAGLPNCKKAAISEALAQNGNADLLVEPQFVVSVRRGFFGSKVTSVTVTGRPAKYVNIHSLGDKVWTDPVFRGVKNATFYIGDRPECPMKK